MIHVPAGALRAYASTSAGGLPAGAAWSVEAHLESCPDCRLALAAALDDAAPDSAEIVRRVGGRLADDLTGERPPAAPRRLGWMRRWLTPALAPKLLVTVLVIVTALGLDTLDAALGGNLPSLLLLVAPVAPLGAVAAAWSPRLDPVHELVVSSPRAGLDLVLRRTLVVLAAVVPVLALAGSATGISAAAWLLPCLVLTAGALALGPLLGPARAALGLGGAWVVIVVAPSLALRRPPVVLDPAHVPAWAAALAVLAVVVALRRRAYQLGGGL